MFGSIGGFEMLVLAIIGLLVFGPRRLPEIGRTVGKAMIELRKAATEVRTSIEREIDLEQVKETGRSIASSVQATFLKDAIPSLDDLTKPAAPAGTTSKTQQSSGDQHAETKKEEGEDAGHVVPPE
jgi:Tat protein translocase TatB subunit